MPTKCCQTCLQPPGCFRKMLLTPVCLQLLHHKSETIENHNQKYRDLNRMAQCRTENAMLAAMTMLMLAHFRMFRNRPAPSQRSATKSMIIPATIPGCSLCQQNTQNLRNRRPSEIIIGNISSDVDKNTAISVPGVNIPPANSPAAAAENPHCGMIPISPPSKGPAFPAR